MADALTRQPVEYLNGGLMLERRRYTTASVARALGLARTDESDTR